MEKKSNEPNRNSVALASRATDNQLDAHGHNLSDYQWVPVLRRPRSDGWTPQRQVEFIAALADYGSVEQAAQQVSMSIMSCYRLRRAPGSEGFAGAWDAAMAQAARKLVDLAFERAINGSEEPVFDREGSRVGRRMRYNDRLLMFLLRAYMPDRFRYAHRSLRSPDEEQAAPIEQVADAIRRLEPVPPDNPHLLMAPDELAPALATAQFLEGELPHWHRGRPDFAEHTASPFEEEFERQLEAAKRQTDGLPAEVTGDESDDAFLA